MSEIADSEMTIVGSWILTNGEVTKDLNSKRIETLVSEALVEISRDKSGWDALYTDPRDNRFWELTFTDSGMHGGGAPRLECVSVEYVDRKYGRVR